MSAGLFVPRVAAGPWPCLQTTLSPAPDHGAKNHPSPTPHTPGAGPQWSARCWRHGAGGAVGLCLALWAGAALAATPTELLATYSQQAGGAPQPTRGQAFFNSRQGRDWSCASCHGAVPTQNGRHASTGKAIQPLAPAFNPERFTDPAKADKWFRRNCNDVLGRACTEAEKADVLAWLLTLKTGG